MQDTINTVCETVSKTQDNSGGMAIMWVIVLVSAFFVIVSIHEDGKKK